MLRAESLPVDPSETRITAPVGSSLLVEIDAECRERLDHVSFHRGVVVLRRVRRRAMVAQVRREHVSQRSKVGACRQPIARRPKEPMENHERRFSFAAEIAMEEVHRGKSSE
jgi:hypothetical protein